jgi:hypothetical protein
LGRVAAPLGVLAAAALVLVLAQLRAPAGYVVTGGDVGFAAVGTTLVAGEDLSLDIASLGDVRLAAGTRVQVRAAGAERHELFVEEGSLHAFIIAAPRVFQVGSPAGLTIDLGCEYELDVQRDGTTHLSVRTGQVAFGADGREVYVPAGASCTAYPGGRISPPVFDDARDEFKALVAAAASGDLLAMKTGASALVEIESHDEGLPLFALLTDPGLPAWIKEQIFEKLARGFDRPDGVTKEAVLAGDAAQVNAWIEESKHYWRRGTAQLEKGD